jgi:hypothetical protein
MLKRIEELAKEAGIMVTPWARDNPPHSVSLVHMDSSVQLEKFVELIIGDCTKMIDQKVFDSYDPIQNPNGYESGWDCGMLFAAGMIKERFGVSK